MLELARVLSRGLPFARVDLYEVESKIYFGEITLYPAGGFGRFDPPEWDTTLGAWFDLPSILGASGPRRGPPFCR